MSEQCPLNLETEITPRVHGFSELSPTCAACLGRLAGRLNIQTGNSSLGILVSEKAPKRLMVRGRKSYYPIPGKTRASIMDCDVRPGTQSVSESSFETLVVERRSVKVKLEDEIIEIWRKEELYKGYQNRVHLLQKLLEYAGQTYMVEELTHRLVYDFVIASAAKDLRYGAHAISRMESIFSAATYEKNVDIMMDIWRDIYNDPEGHVAKVLLSIQAARKNLPRKTKKDYPIKPTSRRSPSNVIDLDEVRRKKRENT